MRCRRESRRDGLQFDILPRSVHVLDDETVWGWNGGWKAHLCNLKVNYDGFCHLRFDISQALEMLEL